MRMRKMSARFTEQDIQRIVANRVRGTSGVGVAPALAGQIRSEHAGQPARGSDSGNGEATRVAKKRSKYGNRKTVIDGITFDSNREALRYVVLCARVRAGIISDLRLQVVFVLADGVLIAGRRRPPLRYIADFVYLYGGNVVVEDAKGVITEGFRIKRHLMKAVHGIEVLSV